MYHYPLVILVQFLKITPIKDNNTTIFIRRYIMRLRALSHVSVMPWCQC